MLGFVWTSGYGLVLAIAVGITTIGGAFALIFGGAQRLVQFIRPSGPLVSFGHPSEHSGPMVYWLTDDPIANQRQDEAIERARLSSLSVSYLIENKDDVALRELSTGIRTRDGAHEHTFSEHVVQILAAGETTEVAQVTVPVSMHEGMTDSNRELNFLYWARFFGSSGRRWEAIYDPMSRRTTYRRGTPFD
jgi:hypothetical protein